MSSVSGGKSVTSPVDMDEARALGTSDVVIAVMGVTGSGKSTFVSQLVGENVAIGHSLHSETKVTHAYEFHRPGQGSIHIVDTPGFDDTFTSDAEVLRDIAGFMTTTYKSSVKLAGIIYLHRITDNRVPGSALRNLRMFKELCGKDAYKHVVLVTSMWNKLHEMDKKAATQREMQLVGDSGFWKDMHDRGSLVKRWHADKGSANNIIDGILAACNTSGNMTLQIQREIVDQHKDLVTTSAGREVNRELTELQKRLDKEIHAIVEDSRKAIAEGDTRLHEQLEKQREEFEGCQKRAVESRNALQVKFQELLQQNAEKYRREKELLEEELAAKRRSNERPKADSTDGEGKMETPGTKEEKAKKRDALKKALSALTKIAVSIAVAVGARALYDEVLRDGDDEGPSVGE